MALAIFADPPLTLVAVYCPFANPSKQQRLTHFWQNFQTSIADHKQRMAEEAHIASQAHAPTRHLVLTGDFNIAPTSLDVSDNTHWRPVPVVMQTNRNTSAACYRHPTVLGTLTGFYTLNHTILRVFLLGVAGRNVAALMRPLNG